MVGIHNRKHQLGFDLLKEENKGFLEAANNSNLFKVADALAVRFDIRFGTFIKDGIQRDKKNQLGSDGKPI